VRIGLKTEMILIQFLKTEMILTCFLRTAQHWFARKPSTGLVSLPLLNPLLGWSKDERYRDTLCGPRIENVKGALENCQETEN
jgi:hypothetical protein